MIPGGLLVTNRVSLHCSIGTVTQIKDLNTSSAIWGGMTVTFWPNGKVQAQINDIILFLAGGVDSFMLATVPLG